MLSNPNYVIICTSLQIPPSPNYHTQFIWTRDGPMSMGVDFEALKRQETSDPAAASKEYMSIITSTSPVTEQLMADKEEAVMRLAALFARSHMARELAELIRSLNTLWTALPKIKAAKLVKSLVGLFDQVPNAHDVFIALCHDLIRWCEAEKRIFLKQTLEARLVSLYLAAGRFVQALDLIQVLLKDLRKLDDKMALLEMQLLESRVYLAIKNVPKARASLTSARTCANAIYCPPSVQAALDMQSGTLHSEEMDFKTAYSYFFEALDAYAAQDDPRAVSALKYMFMCLVMQSTPERVASVLSTKVAAKYAGHPEILAMRQISQSQINSSVSEFQAALAAHAAEIQGDPVIGNHLQALYESLVEKNISRIVRPYSRVFIPHIARVIGLDAQTVEAKLSKMILDQTISGILDQNEGCLILFDKQVPCDLYSSAIENIKQLSAVIDALYLKTKALAC